MVWFVFSVLLFVGAVVVSVIFNGMVKQKEQYIEKQKDRIKEFEQSGDPYNKISWLNEHICEATVDLTNARKIRSIASIGCAVVAVIFLALSVMAAVPTGHTGILTTFGKVSDTVLPSGINFKLPWQNVVNMDNREQRIEFNMSAFSKDIQQVDIKGSINVNINKTTAMNLYKDVGVDYSNILIMPRVLEDVKIVIAAYTAETLVENRQKCSDAIFELVRDELSVKGINVISFAIENIDFTDAFESAVEAKQVATQEKQKAQTEQERQTMEMQQKAERDRIQAQAAADVQKIEAEAKAYAVKVEADAQSEANRKIAETLSESLIQYNMIKQWDGKVPVVNSGKDSSTVIDVRSLFGE